MAAHSSALRVAAGALIAPPRVDNPSQTGDILTNMRRTPNLEPARGAISSVNSAFFGLDGRLSVSRRRGRGGA